MMRPARALPALAGMLLAASAASAQTTTRGFPVAPTASIRIFSLAGQIVVRGWDRDSVHVQATLPPGTGRFFAGGGSGGAKMGVEPNDPAAPPPARLEVLVPAQARLWIKSGDATVQVTGVQRGLDIYTVSGRVVVEGPVRELNVEAMDAEVQVRADAEWARLKSAGGAISFRGRSEDLEVTSVSGAIDVSGGTVGRARIETVSGDLRFASTPAPRGFVELQTHSGTIVVALPASAGANVLASTLHGQIVNTRTTAQPGPGDAGPGLELDTRFGGGQASVRLRSFKGTIRLEAPPPG